MQKVPLQPFFLVYYHLFICDLSLIMVQLMFFKQIKIHPVLLNVYTGEVCVQSFSAQQQPKYENHSSKQLDTVLPRSAVEERKGKTDAKTCIQRVLLDCVIVKCISDILFMFVNIQNISQTFSVMQSRTKLLQSTDYEHINKGS